MLRRPKTFFGLHKRRFTHEALAEPKPPYSALQKDIAIGFAMAIGFRNEAYRTIFDVWCGYPEPPAKSCFRQLRFLLFPKTPFFENVVMR